MSSPCPDCVYENGIRQICDECYKKTVRKFDEDYEAHMNWLMEEQEEGRSHD